MESKKHDTALRVITNEEIHKKKEQKNSLNVGRIWLHGAQEGNSLLRQERNIALIEHMANVGNIGHSYHNARGFIGDIHQIAISKIKAFMTTISNVTRQKPVCALAIDKMTVNHRSVMMVAVIVNWNGQLKALYLKSPLCKDQLDGPGLFALLKAVMHEFSISLSQVTAVCADGEIRAKLQDIWSEETGSNAEWCGVNWDLGHCIELARGDIAPDWLEGKREKNEGIIQVITKLNEQFKYGKKFEIGKTIAEDELNTKWYHPQTHSSTRWAQYEHRVINAFLKNYDVFVKFEEQESKKRTPVTQQLSADAYRHGKTLSRIKSSILLPSQIYILIIAMSLLF